VLQFITTGTRKRLGATLERIRQLGSDGFLLQADVCRPHEVRRIFQKVRSEIGLLNIFVGNARPEAPTFDKPPVEITLDKGTPLWIRR
jgi:NAD(P)-dependent dehydrogenase (short-subunit alcohol dehydrogenase family)